MIVEMVHYEHSGTGVPHHIAREGREAAMREYEYWLALTLGFVVGLVLMASIANGGLEAIRFS